MTQVQCCQIIASTVQPCQSSKILDALQRRNFLIYHIDGGYFSEFCIVQRIIIVEVELPHILPEDSIREVLLVDLHSVCSRRMYRERLDARICVKVRRQVIPGRSVAGVIRLSGIDHSRRVRALHLQPYTCAQFSHNRKIMPGLYLDLARNLHRHVPGIRRISLNTGYERPVRRRFWLLFTQIVHTDLVVGVVPAKVKTCIPDELGAICLKNTCSPLVGYSAVPSQIVPAVMLQGLVRLVGQYHSRTIDVLFVGHPEVTFAAPPCAP